jgi:predicted SprT family Zn-dependent metalloprotease
MSFAQNVAQLFEKMITLDVFREKELPESLGYFCNLEKCPKKKMPNRRKLAQSGRPGRCANCRKTLKLKRSL